MTYESPTSGRAGRHVVHGPAHGEDLVERREAMQGLGQRQPRNARPHRRLPQQLPHGAHRGAADWFAQADPAFAENIKRYYEMVREQDLLTTHTLIPPQANRSQGAGQQMGGTLDGADRARGRQRHRRPRRAPARDDRPDRRRAARLPLDGAQGQRRRTRRTRSRSRSTATPPACASSAASRWIYGRSHFDHPLGSRFEEMDAVVVFDDVHVPFERCFLLGNPRDVQRLLRRDVGRGAHDPPGRDPHDGEDRVHARPDLAA